MKNILKHIIISAVIIISAACSREEFTPASKGQPIEFVLRQTGFNGLNVATNETKALTTEQLTDLETKIHSLYFLVYDASGNRCVFQPLVSDMTSQTLYHNYGNGPLTVCYLANVPQDYAESIDHIDDFANVPLDGISYTYDKTSDGDFVVIPQIGGVQCIPMFGKVAYPGATVNGNVVEIPLERLFAKVVVSLKADLNDSDWGIDLNPPSIELQSFSVVNLPKKVALQEALATDGTIIRESAWVMTSDAFAGPIGTIFDPKLNVSDDVVDFGGISLSGFTKAISCYIPEYALTPSSSNTANDQKLKPTFCPSDKHPVFLTFKGVAKQDKMVDVPLEYFIHFGENPYDSFSLRRNTQYDNNLTIKGTLDAVLENDKRVEPTYHNLADPTNSGTLNPANCYIISKPGRYLIPTYVGNDVNQLLSGDSAEVLSLNGSTNNRIDNIGCVNIDGKNYIQFDVNMFDAAGNRALTDVAGGNKLLVLKDKSGQIIWSWHLWMCDDGNRPDEYYHIYPVTEDVVMNRALGAINSEGFEGFGLSLAYWDDGLYYQWGRKDPLLTTGNPVNTTTSYTQAKQNPRTFYTNWAGTYANEDDAVGWTSEKSINDPCPPGYKVPTASIWAPHSSTGLEDLLARGETVYPYNMNASLDITHNVIYPYSAYLAGSSVHEPTLAPYTDKVEDRKITDQITATMFYFGDEILYDGELWSSNGSLYFFRNKRTINDGAQIFIHFKYTINLGFLGKYEIDQWYPENPAESADGYTLGSIKSGFISTIKSSLGNLAGQTVERLIKNVDIDGMLRRVLEGIMPIQQDHETKLKTDSDATPLYHGAHVRCVRE